MGRPRKEGQVTYGALRYRAIKDGTWKPGRTGWKPGDSRNQGFKPGHTVNLGRHRFGLTKSGLEPTEHPTMLNIAWAAGVYEGEGTCQRAGSHRRTEVVKIGQKEIWLLHRLRALFGGSVSEYKQYRYADGRHREPFAYWMVTGPRARGFLSTIFTFLSPRRRGQVKAVLDFSP